VTLRVRLMASFAYVLVLVIVALEVPLGLNLSRRVDAEVKSEAQGQAQLVAASASGRLDARRDLDRLVGSAATDLGGRVIVVDARGRLLADSAGSGLRLAPYASRPEIASALGGRPEQGKRHSSSLGEDLLFTAVPVMENGKPAGAVRVTQSVDEVHHEVRRDAAALVGLGLGVLLLGLGLAWLLAGSLARPLRGLAATARRIAGGQIDERAKVSGSREQREVALAFNEMTARLASAINAQREFVANASHQLRTPLTGLRLRLEAAGLRADDPELARELAEAEREAERLARLLRELLTLAREGERPAEAARLSIADEVEAAVARWSGPAVDRDQHLQLAGGPDVAVHASREELGIVLDNLIENALEYSPPEGTVTIAWSDGGGWARLAVCDEGPGVPAGEQERIFERFYRGSAGGPGSQGSGLGLPIVRALVQRWGGEVTLGNRPEGGARAELGLPCEPAPDNPSPNLDLELDEALPSRN
jgi:two-component system, OmpR family, sensor kinase